MDVRALRYFQIVAECGSYSRGSELLHISQPAVSRTIRNLEEELGQRLFRRHGHGVTLTESGRMLIGRSRSILRQLEQAKAEIRDSSSTPSGTISFAVPPAAGHFLMPTLVERFAHNYPNVFLKIVGGFSGYIHDWLVRGQVDLACLHDPLPQRGFKLRPLLNEEVFLVGKVGSFPKRKDHAVIEDLATLPLILPSRPNASRRLLDSWLSPSGSVVTPRMEVDDHTIARALICQGVGFSLLTRGAIDGELRRGEIEALPLRPQATWQLTLITYQNAPQSEIHDIFAQTVAEVVHEQTASGAWPGKSVVQAVA
jgi:LysR family transcriptional regulator, nitrogen assimilation regulatory protein